MNIGFSRRLGGNHKLNLLVPLMESKNLKKFFLKIWTFFCSRSVRISGHFDVVRFFFFERLVLIQFSRPKPALLSISFRGGEEKANRYSSSPSPPLPSPRFTLPPNTLPAEKKIISLEWRFFEVLNKGLLLLPQIPSPPWPHRSTDMYCTDLVKDTLYISNQPQRRQINQSEFILYIWYHFVFLKSSITAKQSTIFV